MSRFAPTHAHHAVRLILTYVSLHFNGRRRRRVGMVGFLWTHIPVSLKTVERCIDTMKLCSFGTTICRSFNTQLTSKVSYRWHTNLTVSTLELPFHLIFQFVSPYILIKLVVSVGLLLCFIVKNIIIPYNSFIFHH